MSAPVEVGDILSGKYRVERVLGQGGMGVVVQATHVQLDERVAVKFLLPEALGNQDAVARFLREARAAVKIRSEFVARVTDVGTLEETGSPYMVMEYLEGQDLEGVLEERGPLPVEEAVEYVMQACAALADAHSLGIIHRDLKPANLFRTVRSDGAAVVKVLDFGISKVNLDSDSAAHAALTATSAVLGTPMYMSPEQIRSTRDVDARTDIWSLGSILHELLCGQQPFPGDTLPSLFASILEATPTPLEQIRPDAPPELGAVLQKCLAKKRDDRYQNVAELAAALAPFGPPHAQELASRAARVLGLAPITHPPPATRRSSMPAGRPTAAATAAGQTGAAWSGTTSQKGSRKTVIWGGVAAGALIVAGVLGIGIRARISAEPLSPPPPSAAAAPPEAKPPVVAPSPPRVEPALAPAPAPAPSVEPPVASATAPEPAPVPTSAPVKKPKPPVATTAAPEPARTSTSPKKNPLSIELK